MSGYLKAEKQLYKNDTMKISRRNFIIMHLLFLVAVFFLSNFAGKRYEIRFGYYFYVVSIFKKNVLLLPSQCIDYLRPLPGRSSFQSEIVTLSKYMTKTKQLIKQFSREAVEALTINQNIIARYRLVEKALEGRQGWFYTEHGQCMF